MSTVSDAQRHRLHKAFEEIMGEDHANVLFDLLPPSGWADVARTRDLDHLDQRLTSKIDALDQRLTSKIDALNQRLTSKIDEVDHRLSSKIDALDRRLTSKIDEVDQRLSSQIRELDQRMELRFQSMESKFEAALERGLRDQYNRFLLTMVGVVSVVTALGQLFERLVP